MSAVRILVVEDESLIALDLVGLLKKLGYETLKPVPSGEEAIKAVKALPPDLILLDINLKGDLDGIETAQRLQHDLNIPIIFLTALMDAETVERAKKVKPAAYIVKPFNRRELEIAIELALHNFTLNEQQREVAGFSAQPSAHPSSTEDSFLINDSIFVRTGTRFEKVSLKEIMWLEASGNYSIIVTPNHRYTLTMMLSIVLQKLNRPNFVRIHRSYVVNAHCIDAFEESAVRIKDHSLPIARSYRSNLLQQFHLL